MGEPLNFFPNRAPIGRADAIGNVYMTPEFTRALAVLMARMGGATGPGMDDLALEAATPSAAPLLANLVAELQHQLAQATTQLAELAELRKRFEHEALDRAAPLPPRANPDAPFEVAPVLILPGDPLFDAPPPTDWEHPGKIGAGKANSGAFTTLATSGRLTVGNPVAQSSVAITAKQLADGGDSIFLQRATDTTPTGYLLRAVNAANSANLVLLDVQGNLTISGGISAGPVTSSGRVQGSYARITGGAAGGAATDISLGNSTATAATAGTAGALPTAPAGYWTIFVGANAAKIPYYNT